MFRCLTTNAPRALILFCATAMVVGCGSDEKKDPKVQNPEVGLKQRPEPASPGGGTVEGGTKGKGAAQPGAGVGVQ